MLILPIFPQASGASGASGARFVRLEGLAKFCSQTARFVSQHNVAVAVAVAVGVVVVVVVVAVVPVLVVVVVVVAVVPVLVVVVVVLVVLLVVVVVVLVVVVVVVVVPVLVVVVAVVPVLVVVVVVVLVLVLVLVVVVVVVLVLVLVLVQCQQAAPYGRRQSTLSEPLSSELRLSLRRWAKALMVKLSTHSIIPSCSCPSLSSTLAMMIAACGRSSVGIGEGVRHRFAVPCPESSTRHGWDPLNLLVCRRGGTVPAKKSVTMVTRCRMHKWRLSSSSVSASVLVSSVSPNRRNAASTGVLAWNPKGHKTCKHHWPLWYIGVVKKHTTDKKL